jgi:hypothetical protein
VRPLVHAGSRQWVPPSRSVCSRATAVFSAVCRCSSIGLSPGGVSWSRQLPVADSLRGHLRTLAQVTGPPPRLLTVQRPNKLLTALCDDSSVSVRTVFVACQSITGCTESVPTMELSTSRSRMGVAFGARRTIDTRRGRLSVAFQSTWSFALPAANWLCGMTRAR